MRRLGQVVAVLATGMAGAAHAQVAVPTPELPAFTTPSRAPLAMTLAPVAMGGSVERSTRLTNRLRLRVTLESAASGAGAGARDRVHSRLIGQMVDFFPAGDHGFHLSAGTRLFNPGAPGAAEVAARGLLPSQRRLNIPGLKTTMRRAPALTLGYTDRIDADTSLGFEVGAMQGRAYNDAADVARQTRLARNAIGRPINPVVNLVIGHRF
ncbi:hypothetical protein M9979_09880 [Sphingomonas sp. RP10(2022)]|uniref:Uncharacterized protein n=1 Tax=Sphingomonas liriopis TaxID=2949094 RepID=A0A9X2KQP4_9SPHN|nr:hypothetical protein [Sphingomonas liriopis]MCP3735177.1 hypothetical protein [Sphingomonas liriopis]